MSRFSLFAKPVNDEDVHIVYLLQEVLRDDLQELNEQEYEYVINQFEEEKKLVEINRYNYKIFVVYQKPDNDAAPNAVAEDLRVMASHIRKSMGESAELNLLDKTKNKTQCYAFIEGLVLSNYKYNRFKEGNIDYAIRVNIDSENVDTTAIKELEGVLAGVYHARNLVNDPYSHLTTQGFSNLVNMLAKDTYLDVQIWNEEEIKANRMNGLLAVNKASNTPPRFVIIEHKPTNAVNKKPYILVGKGVVYDTGGLSLKTTHNSMDIMKCDMAGGATVVGTLYSLSRTKLPLWTIGLIPVTDNAINNKALVPGDVIFMKNYKSVEVMNTDAEGRLILADALCYASELNPELTIDIATLTGSALNSLGHEGIVFMGNAPKRQKDSLLDCGYQTHERLVEFPLWNEYDKQLKSDIADLKNVGGPTAGAITAGKFLSHFIDYDWLHLDIAGPAYLSSEDYYRGKYGTGVGIRLLYQFLKQEMNESRKEK